MLISLKQSIHIANQGITVGLILMISLHIDRELEGTVQVTGILGGDDSSGILSLKKADTLVYSVDNLSDFQE